LVRISHCAMICSLLSYYHSPAVSFPLLEHTLSILHSYHIQLSFNKCARHSSEFAICLTAFLHQYYIHTITTPKMSYYRPAIASMSLGVRLLSFYTQTPLYHLLKTLTASMFTPTRTKIHRSSNSRPSRHRDILRRPPVPSISSPRWRNAGKPTPCATPYI
jgi:hypothetical protein